MTASTFSNGFPSVSCSVPVSGSVILDSSLDSRYLTKTLLIRLPLHDYDYFQLCKVKGRFRTWRDLFYFSCYNSFGSLNFPLSSVSSVSKFSVDSVNSVNSVNGGFNE